MNLLEGVEVWFGGVGEGFGWVFAVGGEGEGFVFDFDDGVDDLAVTVGWFSAVFDGGVELLGGRGRRECEGGLPPVGAGAVVEHVVGDGDGAFASGAGAFPVALKIA